MTPSTWWLLAVFVAVAGYELGAAMTHTYPTISEDVWSWPVWALVLIVAGLAVLIPHFILGWRKRHPPS